MRVRRAIATALLVAGVGFIAVGLFPAVTSYYLGDSGRVALRGITSPPILAIAAGTSVVAILGVVRGRRRTLLPLVMPLILLCLVLLTASPGPSVEATRGAGYALLLVGSAACLAGLLLTPEHDPDTVRAARGEI